MGCRGVAVSVHGELVLRQAHSLWLRETFSNRRTIARGALPEAQGIQELLIRAGHVEAALLWSHGHAAALRALRSFREANSIRSRRTR